MDCYATKNGKIEINDKEYREKYRTWLNFYWECIDTNPYVDPDMLEEGQKTRINSYFYEDLCTFLNKQNGRKYNYTNKDKFISDENGINLVSDQFGFSAPKIPVTHPYEVYLQKCKQEGRDKDLAINNVIRWVMISRTIGGSFLWPNDIWKKYNMKRGGSATHRGGSYIQDRVDLTLLEIKHFLDNKDNVKGDILKVEDENSRKWLMDFGSFANYVDYFCLDSFVDKNKDYMPYDIVQSDMEHSDFVCLKDNELQQIKKKDYFKTNSIFNLDSNTLERMFNNVSKMIINRTNTMEQKINNKK